MEILQGILGEDAKIYNGAKVASEEVIGTDGTRTIKKIYFQPKDSKYYVEIDLVAGTVSEAVKIEGDTTMPEGSIQLDFSKTSKSGS